MNKNLKRIIALTLAISAYGTISAITPGTFLDKTATTVYAASYSPDDGELKTLKIESLDGDSLDLRDDYNGSNVKLSEDREYYSKLTTDSDGIEISSKVEGDDYVVKIFTSDKEDAIAYEPGDEILLEKGDTTLYIRTYESESAFRKAKNSLDDVSICEEEYVLNIRKTKESSYEDSSQDPVYLYSLESSRGDISFLKGKTSYSLKVDSTIDHINVTAVPEDDDDRVRINGSLVDSDDKYKRSVDLDNGKNEIKIKVTDSKDNQRTYTLNVTRGSSSDDAQDEIYLDELTLSEGDIDFDKDETEYTVDLDEQVSKITIGATPEDEDYAVTIDGEEVVSDDDYEKKVSLDKGENEIKVKVLDELNDEERTYTLTINRGEATDTDDKDEDKADENTGKASNWVETDDGWMYNDENGKPLKDSWLYDKDAKVYYYLNAEGIRETGWVKYKDLWYLLNEDGVMQTGWKQVNGLWYKLDENGAMRTGWYKEETTNQSTDTQNTQTSTETAGTNVDNTKTETWYYFNEDGSMRTGWLKLKEKWYFFNTNGTMQKGWLINSNSKYYLNEDGTMVTGTKTIEGKEYKFTVNGVLIL